MTFTRLLCVFVLAIVLYGQKAQAETFEELVQILAEHPQVQSILAESDASRLAAKGETGLPNPTFSMGIDNMPLSDPSFDKFLPTSKTFGISQGFPNKASRTAKSGKLEDISGKQKLMAVHMQARLRYMLTAKLAEYESIKTRTAIISAQISHYGAIEESFQGQVESGKAVYQRLSEVDVARAELERKLNDLDAHRIEVEAAFMHLVGGVPDILAPEVAPLVWEHDVSRIYAVQLAAIDVEIAKKDVRVADAALLPDYGVDAIYKQRESAQNGSFSGDDWFSVQARVSVPLWASRNQKPKQAAAKARERSKILSYENVRRKWAHQMMVLTGQRDAAAKNILVLENKSEAMKEKISAAERNYESGMTNLDIVLLAKIDRLNIEAQLAEVQSAYIKKSAEFNAHIVGDYKGIQK